MINYMHVGLEILHMDSIKKIICYSLIGRFYAGLEHGFIRIMWIEKQSECFCLEYMHLE